jgi:dCMP deaminase
MLPISHRPTWNEYFMLLAKLAATRSTCRAAAVGAVVVKDKQVLATGYNGPPAGAHHCTDMGYCYEGISRCDADQAYPSRSSHAEANAIAMAAKKGISVDGATIYATLEPCLSCLKLIIASGIQEIYFEVPLALRTDGQGFAKAALVNEGLVRMERIQLSEDTITQAIAFLCQPTSLPRPEPVYSLEE